MKNIFIIVIIYLFLPITIYSQYNNIWLLGTKYGQYQTYPKYGLNFFNNQPDTFTHFRAMPFFLTNSSYCDFNGNLLFASNGIYISNANYDTLQNSTNFNPGYYTTQNLISGLNMFQSVLFLPDPGNQSEFYVFHESSDTITIPIVGIHKAAPLSLKLSKIDLNLDNGLGGVLPNLKSITLINDTMLLGQLTACKHGNGRDWWVLAQKLNDSVFYKILITPDSVQVFTQQIGFPIVWDIVGQAVFSPDGSKYVLVSQELKMDVFDFDRCNGTLYNHQHVELPDSNFAGYTGASISTNNKYLYINNAFYIYQFDLSSYQIDTTIQLVAINDSFPAPIYAFFGVHSLAADGKIYITTQGGTKILHSINHPDSSGISCDVLQHSLVLPGPGSNASLPVFPNYNLGPLYGSACDSLSAGVEVFAANNINLQIAPNPITDDVLHVTYKLPQNKGGTLKVFDITGKEVFKYALPPWSTLQNLNLPMLSDGMYFCTVSSGVYRMSKRFVKMKE